ncbi:MAG: hypothetical protein HC877_00650 [Thioploca sp.]|nr:hypothetical protein [Thioploca sp.]
MIKFITVLNKHSKLVNVFIFSLIGLFTWLIYLAACWGLADLLTKPASYRLSLWEQQGLNTESAWENTLIQLKLAIDLEPENPDLLELISRAYYLHSNFDISIKLQLTSLQQALNYNLQAIRQRPVSAYTWANIALLKSQLKQYDAQFETALKQAIIWGKWEPLIQHLVIEAGLDAWYQLSQSTRWLVLAAIERGIFLQPQLIKALINKYQRIYTLCAYLDLYKEHPGFANTFSIDRQPIQLIQFCQQINFGETKP